MAKLLGLLIMLSSVYSYADCDDYLYLVERNQLIGKTDFQACSNYDLEYLSRRTNDWIKNYSTLPILTSKPLSLESLDLKAQLAAKIATLSLIKMELMSRAKK
jgi:hypothetical protein